MQTHYRRMPVVWLQMGAIMIARTAGVIAIAAAAFRHRPSSVRSEVRSIMLIAQLRERQVRPLFVLGSRDMQGIWTAMATGWAASDGKLSAAVPYRY